MLIAASPMLQFMRDSQKVSFDDWVSPLPRGSRLQNRLHLPNGTATPIEIEV